ncbi:hypothetical protein SDC9_168846 [bioreactor metagenome]|uniref:DNA replication and repair protein RecF n=1 Tax=bioreactor metagenome TaxID=1076179 RepID=A0A645G5R4_9ZZZZ
MADSLGEARDIDYFSAGTKDQIYLSLRLALLDMLEGETQKLPLILDDAFCQFDDGRLKNALVSLAQAGCSRQVILFTCHTRETEYLEEIIRGLDRTAPVICKA